MVNFKYNRIIDDDVGVEDLRVEDIDNSMFADTIEKIDFGSGDVNARDTNGRTRLYYACFYNNIYYVDFLIKNDAMPFIPDNDDMTPIMIAVKYGYLEIVKYFIENEIEIIYDSISPTPMDIAREYNQNNIIEYLTQNNFN